MKPYSAYHRLLILFYTSLLFSCHTPVTQDTIAPAKNLFGASQPDSALFRKTIDSTQILLSADTAFVRSGLVVTAHIIAVDSMVHHKEQAPFYLITALPDSCLKGSATLTRQRLYFISHIPLPRNGPKSSTLYFLKAIKEKGLMQESGIYWQWLEKAPFNSTLAELKIPRLPHLLQQRQRPLSKKRRHRRVAH